MSQAVVEGSEAVRQRIQKVTSSSRRSSPQRYLGGLSIRDGPGYGPNVCPEPVGYYSSTAVYSSTTVVPFFSSTHVSEGARPTQGLIVVSRVRTRSMARLFELGQGSSVKDSARLCL